MAHGRIRGFNELEPEGNRRILRCLVVDLGSCSGKSHDIGLNEPLDRMDIGLEVDEVAERNEAEALDIPSYEPDCLVKRGGMVSWLQIGD